MTTTDTIKALRDALTEIAVIDCAWRQRDLGSECLRFLAALTADASEDAPDADTDTDTVHAWFHRISSFGPWIECTPSAPDAQVFYSGAKVQRALAARPAPTTAAPNTSKNRVEAPESRMDTHFHGGAELARPAPVAATPAPADPMPTRGGEIEPNAYDHLRDQYESIFSGPGSMASWQRKQTITGDLADEYIKMRVQFGWMAFQAGHRIASRAAAPAAPIAEVKPVAWRIWRSDRWCFGYSANRDFYRSEKWEPLYTHPAPQPQEPAGVCPARDVECGDSMGDWCATCPKWTTAEHAAPDAPPIEQLQNNDDPAPQEHEVLDDPEIDLEGTEP